MQKTRTKQERIIDCLTQPDNDNSEFVYLIHGIGPRINLYKEELNRRIDNLYNPNFHYCASLIGIFEKSEIYQVGTFRNKGLILKPDPQYIRIAWLQEVGSPIEEKQLEKWLDKHDGKILDPYEILEKTHDIYNQLVLTGNPNLEIQGIFYTDEARKSSVEKFSNRVRR